jgi:hypothetical protein
MTATTVAQSGDIAALARNGTNETEPATPPAALRDNVCPIRCVASAIVLSVNTARKWDAGTNGAAQTSKATEALARSAIAKMYV